MKGFPNREIQESIVREDDVMDRGLVLSGGSGGGENFVQERSNIPLD